MLKSSLLENGTAPDEEGRFRKTYVIPALGAVRRREDHKPMLAHFRGLVDKLRTPTPGRRSRAVESYAKTEAKESVVNLSTFLRSTQS